ncbi:dienelactone hydrolase [Aspergillus taichungensis]|uniref:Dienelactone hydrolase n=1 Tax=Aspergillus taichungensis TaxID=482145 RepID=A0A2J5I0G6_9EURO|nr:dienelactone hydrolase [Aspergillus taichungensis]
MATISINAPGASGFLYNNASNVARLCISAETPDFDSVFLREWQDEGFEVVYIPYNGGGKEYEQQLRSVKEGLGVGENYAVLAFGDAASYCLDYYLKPTASSRLCALIAYYPTAIPDTRSRFSPSLRVLVHLAGSTVDVVTTPTALGLQGKKRRATREINPGIGTGERLYLGYPAYTYEVEPGFAEHDLDEFDRLAASLAWSRSLFVLRKAFNKDLDLEARWEEHLDAKFFSMKLSSTMEPYVNHLTPTATYTPTLSGGIGTHALRRFYEHHFLRQLPPSMHLRLISRTIGADRVVDELYTSFEHTQEIPWLLPGVAPTGKRVEIVLVSIVSVRGGRLYSEHVYWDQASVLVQVGLLDPKLLPREAQDKTDRMPVVGREAARRVLEEDPEEEGQGRRDYHNRLIRRARAKKHQREGGGDGGPVATPGVEESGTELGGKDDEGGVNHGKGKVVQREGKNPGPEVGNANGGEESTGAGQSKATVEDAQNED